MEYIIIYFLKRFWFKTLRLYSKCGWIIIKLLINFIVLFNNYSNCLLPLISINLSQNFIVWSLYFTYKYIIIVKIFLLIKNTLYNKIISFSRGFERYFFNLCYKHLTFKTFWKLIYIIIAFINSTVMKSRIIIRIFITKITQFISNIVKVYSYPVTHL